MASRMSAAVVCKFDRASPIVASGWPCIAIPPEYDLSILLMDMMPTAPVAIVNAATVKKLRISLADTFRFFMIMSSSFNYFQLW
jgi:hypothetical protein